MALTENYQVSRVPPTIVRTQQDGISQTIGPPPKILAKLLKWTVHTLEIFWWGEDLCGHADIEDGTTAVEDPSWRIHVEYSNGIIQDTASADEIPDHVADLLLALLEFFE